MATPRNVVPPNLPTPPEQYDQRAQQNLLNLLRLFFVSLTSVVNSFFTTRYIKVTQVTGFTETIPDGYDVYIIDAAGVLATGTLTLPATPFDSQVLEITCHYNVTAFTLTANTGQTQWGWTGGSTLTAGSGVRYIYTASDATWNRIS